MTLNGCANSGEIESAFSNVAYAAGGIAGKIETNGEHSIINNVNTGNVHAKGDAGGIVRHLWAKTVRPAARSSTGTAPTAKSISQMRRQP